MSTEVVPLRSIATVPAIRHLTAVHSFRWRIQPHAQMAAREMGEMLGSSTAMHDWPQSPLRRTSQQLSTSGFQSHPGLSVERWYVTCCHLAKQNIRPLDAAGRLPAQNGGMCSIHERRPGGPLSTHSRTADAEARWSWATRMHTLSSVT